MSAKIVKLDEYLKRFRWNIAKSVAHVIGLNPGSDDDVKKADQLIADAAEHLFNGNLHELQTKLVAALEAYDDEAVKDLLKHDKVDEFDTETFNGVDIAEGYKFHCKIANEVARSNFMDWLEEGGLEYLIDGDGRFAVKCPTRKVEYKVGRAFEHMTNKWDRGPIGKDVDPSLQKPNLPDIKRFGLNDNVNEDIDEIAASQPTSSPGTGKGVETGLGPSMFPAKKKSKTSHFDSEELENIVKEDHYTDSEDGVRQLMSDNFSALSVNAELIPDPQIPFVWLAIDHSQNQAWVVYLNEHDAEEINYNEAVKKYSKVYESVLAEGSKKKKRKKTARQREREAKEKLSQLKPAEAGGAEQMMKDFGKHGTDPDRMDKEQKDKKKKELRKKPDIEEALNENKIDESVLGMMGMPTVGRMKELAGLSNDVEITIEPDIAPSCEEHSGLTLALEELDKTFKVYNVLDVNEKEEFRKNLINRLMKEE